MLKPPKELSELNKSRVENTLRFAELSMETTERIVRLQMEAARRAFEENAQLAKAMAEAADPQELISLRTKLAAKTAEQMLAYSKEVYEAAMQSREHLMELMNQSLGGFGKEFQAATEKAFKAMPGGDTPWNAMQAVFAAASSATENLTKLAGQAAEITQAGMRAAAGAAKPAAAAEKPSSRKRT
jgi:phasin family protein